MDRPLDTAYVKRRNRRRLLGLVAGLSVTSAVFAWGPGLIRPTLHRSRLRTARVDTGPIEAVITASGTVLPEVERVLSSPVDARVLRVLKRAGSAVAEGDAIVELDLGRHPGRGAGRPRPGPEAQPSGSPSSRRS